MRLALLGIAASICAAAGSEDALPTIQDMRVVGRVLGFQDDRPSGTVTLAIPYVSGSPASRAAAEAVAALLDGGLSVGNLVLQPLVLPQDRLDSARYQAVLATGGIDGGVLRATLVNRRVPCVTMDRALVERGLCTVAIRSLPNVSIMLSGANAASLGVKFATAFRMMVTEL